MTKEEYQRNLVRMFDSLRSNEDKGEENCIGVKCDDCPLFKDSCYGKWSRISNFRVYEAIEIVENWAKEHPVKTNAEKFKEVFGFEPMTTMCFCVNPDVQCEVCEHFTSDRLCDVDRFWDAEYKPSKEVEGND